MVTDKWLAAIGTATQTVFWAIGYFFGFTLVAALSCGLILPGAFPEIGKPRKSNRSWQLLYKREGKMYLIAEAVALVGWLFLCLLNWAFAYYTNGGV